MSKYLIHSGMFAKAEGLLKDAEKIHPFNIPEITDLSGRLKLMSGKPNDALPLYKKYLEQNKNDFSTIYTIAKLYAQTGNKAEAWKWLESSIDKGFSYSYILQFDTVWDEYRKDQKWSTLMRKLKPKTYPTRETAG